MNDDMPPRPDDHSAQNLPPDNGPSADAHATGAHATGDDTATTGATELQPTSSGAASLRATAMESSLEASRQDEIIAEYNGKIWVSLLCIPLIVIVADACLIQGDGFFGPAVFLVLSAVAFGFAIPGRAHILAAVVTAFLLVLTAWRLAWCGNVLATFIGFWLLFAYCLSLRGNSPFVLRVLRFPFECVPGSVTVIRRIEQVFRSKVLPEQSAVVRGRAIEFILPTVAVLVFGTVFVMANADLVEVVSLRLSTLLNSVSHFFVDLSAPQIFFWILVGVLTAGILQPVIVKMTVSTAIDGNHHSVRSPMYAAFRNTLVSVIAIFGAYLVFELRAFTSGKPPEGFTYSSYAHEGAAWLTVALALSTVTLSLIFRGTLNHDERYAKLEWLAWGWSILNFVLAAAVINRMWIYIAYNGMTLMRIVGLLGIFAVLLGFVLVLVKIRCWHNFRWLLRRQCWVAGLMLWSLSVLPVDVLVHRYNVQAILAGNPAPIVQITAHPFSDECLNEFVPLCASEDSLVADGIRQMLQTREDRLRQEVQSLEIMAADDRTAAQRDVSTSWTNRQWFRGSVLNRLMKSKAEWDTEQRDSKAVSPWDELTTRAYQLYW
ncbi:MAG: DUF4153 domain-containing protein [Fuerstiella sp.]